MAVDQMEFMKAGYTDAAMIQYHYGIYTLDTEYATEEGADVLKVKSIDKAKAALKDAGYKGEKVVFLANTDTSSVSAMNQVMQDLLQKLGMTVEFVSCDYATMAQRRQNKGPTDKGGWSLYLTGWTGNDVLDPAVNPMLRGSGLKGFPGWCTDPELERLRSEWAFATNEADLKRLATAVQVQAFKTLPYIPMGSSRPLTAYRDSLTNVFPAPVGVYWGIDKTA